MVKLTMIARVTDGLPLAEGLDDGLDLTDAEMCKQQAELESFKMEYANARLECNAADECANILASEVIWFGREGNKILMGTSIKVK
ncbi:hypothetical protein V6Z12_D11G268100 [Gossypium hirsutum]